MNFHPPQSRQQLAEILAVTAFTKLDRENAQRIANVYVSHVNSAQPYCYECDDARWMQEIIAAAATSRVDEWTAALNKQDVAQYKNAQ